MKSRGAGYLAYLSFILVLGALVLGFCLYRLVTDRVSYQWLILAYLTVITGAFTIAIPRVNAKFSVSDSFVFLNTILFGTAAGALTAALDGFLSSIQLETAARRKRATPFNTAVMGVSAFAGGEVFFKLLGQGPVSGGLAVRPQELILPVALLALVYYLCNSFFVALMVAVDERVGAFRVWRKSFIKALLTYAASAGVAGLVALAIRSMTPLMLLLVVLILVVIYFLDKLYLEHGAEAAELAVSGQGPAERRLAYRNYHYFVVALGLGFIALLLWEATGHTVGFEWLVFALLTLASGFVTLKIPAIKIKFSLADTFVLANIVLFGPVAGGITAVLDGLAGSLRCKSKARRVEFALFNIAVMPLAAYLGGELFFRALGHGPLYLKGGVSLGSMFFPAVVMALGYYLVNSVGVAIIAALQAQQRLIPIWLENCLWSSAIYVTSGLGAIFIAVSVGAVTPMLVAAAALMLLAIFLSYRVYVDVARRRTQLSA